jgi:hypothetical protein
MISRAVCALCLALIVTVLITPNYTYIKLELSDGTACKHNSTSSHVVTLPINTTCTERVSTLLSADKRILNVNVWDTDKCTNRTVLTWHLERINRSSCLVGYQEVPALNHSRMMFSATVQEVSSFVFLTHKLIEFCAPVLLFFTLGYAIGWDYNF